MKAKATKIICLVMAALMLTSSTAYAAPRPDPICPEGSYSDQVIGKTELTVVNLPNSGDPYLTWTYVEGADWYWVFYRVARSNTSTWTKLLKTRGNHLTHSSACPGETYDYMVMVEPQDDGLAESYSNCVRRTADTKRPTLEVSTSRGYPRLTWDRSPGATGYEVWYKEPGDGYRRLIKTTGHYVNHKSAKPGHTYTYRVRALGLTSAGNSAYSYTRTVRG